MSITGRSDGAAGGRIRLGMVGGGEGAFIGAVHRLAARMDDHYTFVAGCLSSTPDKARRSGEALGLDPARVYTDFAAMAKAQSKSPSSTRDSSISAAATSSGTVPPRPPPPLCEVGPSKQSIKRKKQKQRQALLLVMPLMTLWSHCDSDFSLHSVS